MKARTFCGIESDGLITEVANNGIPSDKRQVSPGFIDKLNFNGVKLVLFNNTQCVFFNRMTYVTSSECLRAVRQSCANAGKSVVKGLARAVFGTGCHTEIRVYLGPEAFSYSVIVSGIFDGCAPVKIGKPAVVCNAYGVRHFR